MGPRETSNHHHRVVVALEKKRSTEWREKERERGIKREKVIRTFFMCVCMCACASSGVFVYLNIALCAVCAHATRSALRSEEKTLEFVTKKKRKTLSRYHTLSRYIKTEESTKKST